MTWLPVAGPTGSTLSHLEGGLSRRVYDVDSVRNLDPADGKPLLARYDLAAASAVLTRRALASRRTGGQWRWREILPVRDWRFAYSLGEGS